MRASWFAGSCSDFTTTWASGSRGVELLTYTTCFLLRGKLLITDSNDLASPVWGAQLLGFLRALEPRTGLQLLV